MKAPLIDSFEHDETLVGERWHFAKPLNYNRGHYSLRLRLQHMWEVFRCRAVAVRFKGDENDEDAGSRER